MLLSKNHTVQVCDATAASQISYSRVQKNYAKHLMSLLFACICYSGFAQKTDLVIKAGNDAYKKGDYKAAVQLYKDALSADGNNITAKFNLGNAFLKLNNSEQAAAYFSEVFNATADNDFKSKALYNKGLSMVKAQKLPDAIDAFKQSLLLAPDDNDTRENLQKAITELKKKQQSQPQQKPDPKKKPNPKQQDKQFNKDLMEQKFEELRDKEKQLQKLLQRKNSTDQPEKDW
ncbi:hypothetical protein BH11BAC6_BH11BAC6_06330 [soil metagenome]